MTGLRPLDPLPPGYVLALAAAAALLLLAAVWVALGCPSPWS